MLTILFHMVLKPEREQQFDQLARQLITTTHAEDKGCIQYAVYRRADNSRQCVLIEQWENEESLLAHIARLQRLLGPPPEGARLPKALLDHFESFEAIRYVSA